MMPRMILVLLECRNWRSGLQRNCFAWDIILFVGFYFLKRKEQCCVTNFGASFRLKKAF